MKKIVAIVIVVVLATAIAACLAEHLVKVEREYRYKYDETTFSYVSVQVRETVRNLKGDEIGNREYEILKKTNELPWYNVWRENAVEFH